jgi:acetyl/propionyl-CoA carboxylase alpha subunit
MTPGADIVLRDETGAEHRARVARDGAVTVAGVPVPVWPAPDGSLRVPGAEPAIAWTAAANGTIWVFVNGRVFTFERAARAEARRRTASLHGPLTAPMPATVRRVAVEPGTIVRKGDVLLILEAMKMELPVKAIADARVAAVNCREGDLVAAGAALVDLEEVR